MDFIDFLKMCDFSNSVGFKDGASIHETETVRNYEENKNIPMIKNVPYSCDFNAIELLFNFIKTKIKASFITKQEQIPEIFYKIASEIPDSVIKNFVNKVWENFN